MVEFYKKYEDLGRQVGFEHLVVLDYDHDAGDSSYGPCGDRLHYDVYYRIANKLNK